MTERPIAGREMSKPHKIGVERRPATCCDEHTSWWVVCSCGWEDNGGFNDHGETTAAIIAHRLSILEAATGVKVTFS